MRNKTITIDPIEIIQEIFYSHIDPYKFKKHEWCIRDAEVLETAARTIRSAFKKNDLPPKNKPED